MDTSGGAEGVIILRVRLSVFTLILELGSFFAEETDLLLEQKTGADLKLALGVLCIREPCLGES